MTDLRIEREIAGNRGRYVVRLEGEEAELTYSIASPRLIIADHTGVPDAFRGRGVARALAERLVSDARTEGVRIFATCPYVLAFRANHPEWEDVFAS